MKSINPYNNQLNKEYKELSGKQIESIIANVEHAQKKYKHSTYGERSEKMKSLAELLRKNKTQYARLMTLEMGKLLGESEAEIEKCAWVCDYYADNAEIFLADEVIKSDASRSYVHFQPLGIVLAVMPWNFPFWQVFRFAAPALMAGNGALLKHASNVPGCAMEIEKIIREAGFPDNLFRTLLIPGKMVGEVIENPLVKAATLTGSEKAGSSVAEKAGKNLKKTVMELGGSDPFIVLEDAEFESCCQTAVTARMINTGQSCIAAKRFIVVEDIANAFEDRVKELMQDRKAGNPANSDTQLAPLAKPEFVEDIDRQVKESIEMGATLLLGGKRMKGKGNFYEPTVLTNVTPDMPVFKEETFGPVLSVIRVQNEKEAIEMANQSQYGLGGCVWTSSVERGEKIARTVESGAMFVNGMTKSDPRLPFGGIKNSGYGRELSHYGIKEFVNIKTIWIA
ncbi:MAG: NAD-dependent succinate-semialdehyde dehydrogenase [Bacteroidales bacterium]|nr:NAD-dependent succinate-semialdehyde dehydrogenase [Bacteroidales bacterium]MCF8399093.1 NAD-dependent succinate-semialdehyde dehydrogenase [Bacteroidales bacterium]